LVQTTFLREILLAVPSCHIPPEEGRDMNLASKRKFKKAIHTQDHESCKRLPSAHLLHNPLAKSFRVVAQASNTYGIVS
jgi:hypothetical protein